MENSGNIQGTLKEHSFADRDPVHYPRHSILVMMRSDVLGSHLFILDNASPRRFGFEQGFSHSLNVD
jgi:hypothetical protein